MANQRDMIRIDAHQHFWDPSRGWFDWLTPELPELYRTFESSDLAAERAALDISGTIVVQAAESEAETLDLFARANADPTILGVVGWVDLDAGDIQVRIADLAARGPLVGIRPMLQDMPDRHWIANPRHAAALECLTAHDLVLDALIRPDQIGDVAAVALRHPTLRIVIDHAAKPIINKEGPGRAWIAAMEDVARCLNVCCKLSGLLTEAPPGATVTMFLPYFDVLLRNFGPQRLLWGSDWPVLTLAATYRDWYQMAEAMVPKPDHPAIFGKNALRVYAIDWPEV